MGSPPLDEDEWVLLLDLYMRRRPESVTASDPELGRLSDLLARHVTGDAKPPIQWRSPDGLRARLSVFRVLDPDVQTPDTKRTAVSDRLWGMYRGDVDALCKKAAQVRQALTLSSLGRDRSTPPIDQPSRGPVAWAGEYQTQRVDGNRWVYVMRLDQHGKPACPIDEWPYLKIGRTSDIDHRAAELNASFPKPLGFCWCPIDAVLLESEARAHTVEQRLLSFLAARGESVGGEFVQCAPEHVGASLRAVVIKS